MRLSVLAAIAGAFFLGACSSTDLAAFAVGMQEANGTYWPDQSESNTLNCRSGYGYIVEYSGVSGNQGYIYFTNYADNGATIDVAYDDGDSYSLALAYGETSYTIYNHPGYAWNTKYSC
jgi:hypothetical protein